MSSDIKSMLFIFPVHVYVYEALGRKSQNQFYFILVLHPVSSCCQQHTQKMAKRNGLVGWVKNRDAYIGTVVGRVQGEHNLVKIM